MKKLALALVATGALMAAGSAMASGLSLCQTNGTGEINVVCNGQKAQSPIPANGCVVNPIDGTKVITWPEVRLMAHAIAGPFKCTFTDASGNTLGTANISTSGLPASEGSVSFTPSTSAYNVSITPNGSMSANVNATISPKS